MPNRMMTVYKAPDAGERMRDVILSKDMGITDIANKTGLRRNTIYNFLYDGTDISCIRLMKLCAVVGVSADYILGLSNDKEIKR